MGSHSQMAASLDESIEQLVTELLKTSVARRCLRQDHGESGICRRNEGGISGESVSAAVVPVPMAVAHFVDHPAEGGRAPARDAKSHFLSRVDGRL